MNYSAPNKFAAIIAAAGLSRRMGEPKQLLPWGERTVIETVVRNFAAGGAEPVLCVVGHKAEQVGAAVRESDAIVVRNGGYRQHDLLSSYQTGIGWLSENANADTPGALLALGDQPHVHSDIIAEIVSAARKRPDAIIIPSHNMRRGHPIVLPRRLWSDLLALADDDILRTLINRLDDSIVYVNLGRDSILYDIDTAEEYIRLKAIYTPGEQPER